MNTSVKAKNAVDLCMRTENCTVRTIESGQNVLKRAVMNVANVKKVGGKNGEREENRQ